ncbi:MAG TPA: carbamoyltransferase HypF [Thermoplasmata archaeon]|nr:carbamoyltransferase HypF [Thermoplasmata archaeon]
MILDIHVTGVVQGVGFRPFIYRLAKSHNLKGCVMNLGDAGVKITVQGKKEDVYRFIENIKKKTPPLAKIEEIKVEEKRREEVFVDFSIMQSKHEKESAGSIIPSDIGICDDCMRELFDPIDRRYLYFFITCTNCGPRFTIINSIPYDRERTSMASFKMCSECGEEYTNPANRRFHAQTVACHSCGPQVFLTDKRGVSLSNSSIDALEKASKLLAEGNILAVKGNGGFHIACSVEDDEIILRLRGLLGREQQPFAIMARDFETVKRFAHVSEEEGKLLTSPVKPIVVVKKREEYDKFISKQVSPKLHTIGVMLPYTGLHALLFQWNKLNVLIMTSANKPGYPMVVDNEEAQKKLSPMVDYLLMHDRDIVQRCDDSVISFMGGKKTFLRRSRGYVPLPITLKNRFKDPVFATGPDTDVTFCILTNSQAFLSQHIGDTSHYETIEFFKKAFQHFQSLLDVKLSIVTCDLHPRFATTLFAEQLSQEKNIPLIHIQHHHAHLASLLGEHNKEEMICVTADGFGYGKDGNAWGGEILLGGFSGYKRVGHLQLQPLVGGDLAAVYPLRVAAGILGDDAMDFLMQNKKTFPHGEEEITLIFKQLKNKQYIYTTSCGRILDAVAAILGICYKRTYEGEPARKLEAAAYMGKDVLQIEPVIKGNTLDTSIIISKVFEYRDKYSLRDLAYSAEEYVAKGLVDLAVEYAEQEDIRCIGFSGGCAYNAHILTRIRSIVEKAGFEFLQHEKVPPGDGGVSFGQALIAANMLDR